MKKPRYEVYNNIRSVSFNGKNLPSGRFRFAVFDNKKKKVVAISTFAVAARAMAGQLNEKGLVEVNE